MKERLEGLLAETLFSQLLCLPHSRHRALAYSTIMVRTSLVPGACRETKFISRLCYPFHGFFF